MSGRWRFQAPVPALTLAMIASLLVPIVASTGTLSPPGMAPAETASGAVAPPAVVHPFLRSLIEGEDPVPVLPAPLQGRAGESALADGPRIGVWIHAADGGRSLEASGLLAPGAPAPIRRARWTRDEMRTALLDPNLVRLAPAVPCRPSLDSSLVETFTADTHDGSGIPPAYAGLTGAHALIGIVDSGIDLDHDDFRDASNQTRILSVWDQTASGSPPAGFGYGREWTAAQINSGVATESDTDGHGTHVAGIAAGDGSATGNGKPPFRYVGMAPDAAIIFVKTGFYTDQIADGIEYIFDRAAALGLPAVVNLSLGNQFGPHDGTDDFDLTMDYYSRPGQIIVAAAGNEAGEGVHAEAIIPAADSATVTFIVPSYVSQPRNNNDEIDIDGWYTGGANLSFRVITPSGYTVGPVPRGSSTGASTADGRVEIDNGTWVPGNGDENLTIRIYDMLAAIPPREGKWTIRVDHLSPARGKAPAEIDLWTWYATTGSVRYDWRMQDEEIVGSPATADSVIAVGAYITRTRWSSIDGNTYAYDPEPTRAEIADFSSIGPRRDGRLKPDIAAPGMGIGSALSSAAFYDPPVVLPDGVHWVLQGTSMASPHVAGLVALMYQAWGPISAREMRERIAASARADAHTGAVPNNAWGFGKINALAATAYPVPVALIESEAVQEGERVRVRFLLTRDAGTAPFPIWREEPAVAERTMIGWSSTGQERTFTDSTLVSEGTFRYWLQANDAGRPRWIGPAEVTVRLPRTPAIGAAPNPFSDRVRIDWRSPGPVNGAAIRIHDLAGRTVKSFPLSGTTAGSGFLFWDGTDASGKQLPAGVYWMILRSADGGGVATKISRVR